MKLLLLLCLVLTVFFNKVSGQEFNKSINKDSLFKEVIKDVPEIRKQEFIDAYNSGSEQTKEGILFILSMPKSSKKELIANNKANYTQINVLKNRYAKLVPNNYTVSIEFEPENKLINTKASVN